MRKIDYHADDYGISMSASRHIIELIKAGKLDSISIMPNMPAFDESMELLSEEWDTLAIKPKVSIHLNLIDGHSLVDGKILEYSWGYLLFYSYFRGRNYRTIKERIKKEFVCQIQKGLEYSFVNKVRLDSHLHVHMIPIVFDAMMEAVLELGIKDRLEFVRITREPIFLMLFSKEVFGSYPVVNIIKNVLLNFLSIRVVSKLKPIGISEAMVWGMMRSGMMTEDYCRKFDNKIEKYANRKNRYVELVAHPGFGSNPAELFECTIGDRKAIISEYRYLEYSMLMNRGNCEN